MTIRCLKSIRPGCVVCETDVVHRGGRLAALRSELKRHGETATTAGGTCSIGRS